LLYAAFGPAGTVIFLGFCIGYIIYDCVHYACHQLPMRGPVLRQLRRHHLCHHHGREEGNYAITAIFLESDVRHQVAGQALIAGSATDLVQTSRPVWARKSIVRRLLDVAHGR
jgi:hypothetical protein